MYIQELPTLSDRLQKQQEENCCNGGFLIVESFYQELDQQSLSCIARNKCLQKKGYPAKMFILPITMSEASMDQLQVIQCWFC